MTGGGRRSIVVPGLGHGTTPIPMGSRVGNIVYSSAIPGADPGGGELSADPEEQVARAFQNLVVFLREAGATADDVVHLAVGITDDSLRMAVDREWVRLFPDPDSRPARHTSVGPLHAGKLVQLETVAVLAQP